jgi:peptidoglycan LD-endopeptidase LytH
MNLKRPRAKGTAKQASTTSSSTSPGDQTPQSEAAKTDESSSNKTATIPPPLASVTPPPVVPGLNPDLDYLKTKNLMIPVLGIKVTQLRDTFYDQRSEGRIHQALDIMAPQGTPVLATADGRLKLHTSDRGGIMIYEIDPSGSYVYFYGHLQRYADGVADGKDVSRGEVIGYVGDTGNAGPGNFHLHFGISRVSEPGKWSGGEPINPYPLLTGING